MIRVNEISDRLLHLVGWQQNLGTSGVKVADYLTKSESGMYFQQVHPLLTLENLACIAPDFKNMDFPEYSAESNYKAGDYVWHNGKLYKALKDVNAYTEVAKPFIGTPIKVGLHPEGQTTRKIVDGYNSNSWPEMENVTTFDKNGFSFEVLNDRVRVSAKGLSMGYIRIPQFILYAPFNVGLNLYQAYVYDITAKVHIDIKHNAAAVNAVALSFRSGLMKYNGWNVSPISMAVNNVTYFSLLDEDPEAHGTRPSTFWFSEDAFPGNYSPDSYIQVSDFNGKDLYIRCRVSYGVRAQDEDPFRTTDYGFGITVSFYSNSQNNMTSGSYEPELLDASVELSDFTITPVGKTKIEGEYPAVDVPPIYERVPSTVEPGTDGSVWQQTDEFSEWLFRKTQASIQKAVVRFCNEKAAEGTNRMLVENKTLFDGTGRIFDTVKNRNDLVGFEIVPIRAKGVTTRINRISLQFTEPGEYTLYLMHSGMDAPVKVIKLTKIRKNSVEWFDTDDLVLPYEDTDNDAGGSWYLCYRQSELPAGSMAIRKNKDWSKEPCRGCSRNEYLSWQAWSKYLEVHPFYISEELVSPVADFNDDYSDDFAKTPLRMWDVEKNDYTYDNNYGLNLDLTVACDLTGFIVDQRYLFQDVIAKQVAVDMLREFAYNANVRTNRHSINASRLDILYELDGDSSSMKKSGLNYQLDMAYKAIKLNTMGMSRVCLPCKNNGIKFRTV